MFDEIQKTLTRVREKKWAEPVGKALGVTATIVDCVGNFVPGVGFLGGALQLGAQLLNPEPSAGDLKSELNDIKLDLETDRALSSRARKALEKEKAELEDSIANIGKNQTEIRTNILEVQNDVTNGFRMISEDLKTLEKDVSTIKDKISATYDIVCDMQYKNGIERIEATYEAFTASSSDVGKMIGRFHQFALELQTEYYQHMKTEKITKYLKLVMEKDGADACQAMYQYILVVKSKYLQMMTMYFVYNNEPDRVANEFEKFNTDFFDFQTNFEKVKKERKINLKFSERKEAEWNTNASIAKDAVTKEDTVDYRPLPKPPGKEEYINTVALYDFVGQSVKELSFKKGDNIRIFKEDYSGWWTGSIDGKTGLCPSNFLEKEKNKTAAFSGFGGFGAVAPSAFGGPANSRAPPVFEAPADNISGSWTEGIGGKTGLRRSNFLQKQKSTVKMCPKGHPLCKVSSKSQWRCNSMRDGGCWCYPEYDLYIDAEHYSCIICDFDNCGDCYNWDEENDKNIKKCPEGHPLRKLPDYVKQGLDKRGDEWRCNSHLRGCKYFPDYCEFRNLNVYRCESCNFDNCEDCYKK